MNRTVRSGCFLHLGSAEEHLVRSQFAASTVARIQIDHSFNACRRGLEFNAGPFDAALKAVSLTTALPGGATDPCGRSSLERNYVRLRCSAAPSASYLWNRVTIGPS